LGGVWLETIDHLTPGLLPGGPATREEAEDLQEVLDLSADIHILPVDVFTIPAVRREAQDKQWDPHFFENAFSALLRWDSDNEEFVESSIEDLERLFGVDMGWARRKDPAA